MSDTISAHPLERHHWVPRPTGKGSVAMGTAEHQHVCSLCGLTFAQWRLQECLCTHSRAVHKHLWERCGADGCNCVEMHHAS